MSRLTNPNDKQGRKIEKRALLLLRCGQECKALTFFDERLERLERLEMPQGTPCNAFGEPNPIPDTPPSKALKALIAKSERLERLAFLLTAESSWFKAGGAAPKPQLPKIPANELTAPKGKILSGCPITRSSPNYLLM